MARLERAPLALIAALSIAVSGCVYITPEAGQAKKDCLDEDGDLYVKSAGCPELPDGMLGVDCDDERSYRNPGVDEAGTPEFWYDGIDQDCDDKDIIDQDGDLWAPITKDAWELLLAEDGNDIEAWPPSILVATPDGFPDALDCNDEDNTVYPASPAEEPYDGVDSDCGLDNDCDFDKDGFEIIEACLPVGAPACPGLLPATDCNDTDGTVNTDAAVDTWYDGIDQDCDGDNDFDQDGDDFIQNSHISAYNAFVATCGQTDDRLIGHDCNDTPVGQSGVPGASINPDATEVWYDGVDQDCVGDSDYDQDHDTYECDGGVVAACSGHVGTDCNDQVPAINPAALELLGDGDDADCDGDDDGTPFRFHNYLWTVPSRPIVEATDTDYVLALVADQFTFQGAALDNNEAGLALVWSTTASGPPSVPTIKVEYEHAFVSWPLNQGVALATRADGWLVATSHVRGGKTFLRMHTASGGDGSYLVDDIAQHSAFFEDPQYDYDLWVDTVNDQYWLVACGDNSIQFLVATTSGNDLVVVDGAYSAGTGGRACYLEPIDADTVNVHVYDGQGSTGHTEYVLDLETAATTDGSITEACSSTNGGCDATDAFGLVDVNQRDTLTVFAGSNNSASAAMGITVYEDSTLLGEYLTAYEVLSGDAWLHGGILYAVVVADNGDGTSDVVFAYGAPTGALTQVPLDFTHPTLDVEPEGASIYVDDDRVMIGVTGMGDTGLQGDAAGWLFMGHAP